MLIRTLRERGLGGEGGGESLLALVSVACREGTDRDRMLFVDRLDCSDRRTVVGCLTTVQ